MASIYDWSPTAASNTLVGAISIAEGMSPAHVNDGMRNIMADVADLIDDIGGSIETTGSSNAYVATASFEAYATGLRLSVKANHANSGAATLNVNALGVKAIRKIGASGEAAVATGDIIATGRYDLVYDSTANSAAGAWILLNPTVSGGQPLDSDLTAIAALTTDAAGRSILTLSDPNNDRIAFWDDSAGAYAHLALDTGLSISGTTLSLDGDLQNFAGITGTGQVTRTATNTFVTRSIAGGTGITVTNGDGVSGNPSIAIDQSFTPTWTGAHTFIANITRGATVISTNEIDHGTFHLSGSTAGWNMTTAQMRHSVITTAAADHMILYNPNGNVGAARTSASATSWLTSSDERLKTDFRRINDALGLLGQVRMYDYAWKVDGTRGFGPKAQELHEIVPTAVSPGGDDPRENPWSWDGSKMVPFLIAGIQELAAIAANLNARLDAAGVA